MVIRGMGWGSHVIAVTFDMGLSVLHACCSGCLGPLSERRRTGSPADGEVHARAGVGADSATLQAAAEVFGERQACLHAQIHRIRAGLAFEELLLHFFAQAALW